MNQTNMQARKTEALIFDMDGTMINSMPWHALAFSEFARRHGVQMELADLMRRTTGRTSVECIKELFQRDIATSKAKLLIAEKEAIYREMFTPVFAEVAGFKAFAKQAGEQGLKVGVGTAGDRQNIAFAMAGLAMQPEPQTIVGGDEGLPGKPEPAIFLEAALRLGVVASACIVFEDAPFGIEAARRAGMRAVAICTSYSAKELSGPHVMACVRDYNELIANNFIGKLQATTV